MMAIRFSKLIFLGCVGILTAFPMDGFSQIYNPYYVNPYSTAYYGGGYGYGGYNYYNYNAPYSHIYYSPTYSVQPRGYYSIPYYGGYYGRPSHGHKPSKPSGGHYYPSTSRSVEGEVPPGTVGWIPAPVSPRSQRVQSGK